jgi:hypothetical protein
MFRNRNRCRKEEWFADLRQTIDPDPNSDPDPDCHRKLMERPPKITPTG